jgi:hypothetical protein
LRTLRVTSTPPLFCTTFFKVDYDVNSRLEVSRLEIIDADTQDRFLH